MFQRWRTLSRNVLGLNRRNHAVIARYNPRESFQLVDHKVKTKAALSATGLPIVETLAVYRSQHDIRRFVREVEQWDEFVIKPAQGAGGEGVLIVAKQTPIEFLTADGRMLRREDLESHISDVLGGVYSLNQRYDEVLVERRIHPHPTLARLSFQGVPDIRILVFRGIPLLAMLRVATQRSKGRANLHLGGIGIGVDLRSGLTTHALVNNVWVPVHPDTGEVLRGIQVPQWETMLEIAARCAETVALGYLGVDLTLDAASGPVVMELNARPGLLIQLANRRGLRPLIDAVERLPPQQRQASERIRIGQNLFQGELGKLSV